MSRTTYTVRDPQGQRIEITDPERADRLSRAGFRVTARTGGE